MLYICNQFVCDNCIHFNSKNNVCIIFRKSVNDNECVKLNVELLKCNTDVRDSIDSNIKYPQF